MKIDYDKPVKGKLADGWYFAARSTDGVIAFCEVTSGICIPDNTTRWTAGLRVKDWRRHSWQFYHARLPRRGKA